MQTRASQSARIILFQIATLGLLLIINIIGSVHVAGISIRRTPHLRAMRVANLHGALFPQIILNNSIYASHSVHQTIFIHNAHMQVQTITP